MGFFDNIRSIFKRGTDDSTATQETASPARTGAVSLLTSAGAELQIATVYRCVNLLADSVANLPIQYMRLKGDIFVEDRASRLHYVLNVQPCSYMSAVDFWRQVVQYLLLNGNAYIVPVYDFVAMDIAELKLVSPTAVSHDTYNNKYTVTDVKAGVSMTLDESEIIHIKNYTKDGKNGLSTLSFARTTLDITSTGDKETLNRFANGGNVRGIVSNDTSVRGFGEYQDKELEKTDYRFGW